MKKLSTLILALVAIMSVNAAISVTDNSIDDWNTLPEEYVFELTCPDDAYMIALKSAKVYVDAKFINILIEPNMEELPDLEYIPFHVFVNTDNNDATGGGIYFFTDFNNDIMMEGGVFLDGQPCVYDPAVFKWWGEAGTDSWTWTDPSVSHGETDCWGALVCEGSGISNSQWINGIFEIQINKSLIPIVWNKTEIGIGLEIEQEWNTVGFLPIEAYSDVNPSGFTHKLQIKIDNSNVTPEIIQDGLRYEIQDDEAVVVGFESVSGLVEIPTNITVEDVTYPVVAIGVGAFHDCSDITGITFPNSVTAIGASAFYDCTNLLTLEVPETVTTIGNNAFYGIPLVVYHRFLIQCYL